MRSRLNPLTALTAAASVLIITTAAASWEVSLTVALIAVVLAARAGVLARIVPAAGLILAPFWLSLLVMHGLFFPEGHTVLFQWGPARVTAEGLGFAVDMGSRTAAYVLVLMLFSFTVRMPELIAVLAAHRVPPQFGFVLASTLTLAPAIAAQLVRIRQAQESRGLVIRRNAMSRLAAVRVQMVPLVLGLVHEADTRAQALDSRGFRRAGPRTSYREVHDSRAQRSFRTLAILLAVTAVVLRIAGSLPSSGQA